LGRGARIVLIAAAVGVLALISVFAIVLSDTQASSRHDIEARVHERAVLAAALIDGLFQTVQQQVPQDAAKYGGATVSRATMNANRQQNAYLALLDQSGRLIASSDGFAFRGSDFANLPAVALVRSGHPYGLGNVLPQGKTGVVNLAVAFPTRFGERILLTGFATSTLGPFLAGELSKIPGVRGAHNYVIDGGDAVLASTNPAIRTGYRFTKPAEVRALARSSGDRNHHYYDEVGLANSTWRVVLAAPDGPLFASVSGAHKWVPWMIFIAFALVALVALWLGQRVVRSAEGDLRTANRRLEGLNHQLEASNRQLEQRAVELRRSSQAQRLESVGQLAGGIAHDFNNLLVVILNYAQFAAKRIDDAEARDYLEQIHAAAEQAARLTRQLLIVGRREAVQLENIDLNAIVNDIHSLLARSIGEHVALVVQTAPALPEIRADRGQTEQILLNLAVNARDAMPHGGTLTIQTKETVLEMEQPDVQPALPAGPYVQLTITDTGTGISPEIQNRIFEPFFTTKDTGEGTGLGLATVYGIVSEIGGGLTVKSEAEQGTTFTVYFPVAAVASDDQRKPTASSDAGGNETILVVEDEPAVLRLVKRILTKNGYVVLDAGSAEGAMALAAQHQFDLLLTDSVMPIMSGGQLSERIEQIRPGRPVLFMSGYSGTLLAHQAALNDTTALIQKPFTEQALLDKIRDTLSSVPKPQQSSPPARR
jgi:signal transduction histidine kinase/CheY-like chemotaxis protein